MKTGITTSESIPTEKQEEEVESSRTKQAPSRRRGVTVIRVGHRSTRCSGSLSLVSFPNLPQPWDSLTCWWAIIVSKACVPGCSPVVQELGHVGFSSVGPAGGVESMMEVLLEISHSLWRRKHGSWNPAREYAEGFSTIKVGEVALHLCGLSATASSTSRLLTARHRWEMSCVRVRRNAGLNLANWQESKSVTPSCAS